MMDDKGDIFVVLNRTQIDIMPPSVAMLPPADDEEDEDDEIPL